MSCATAPRSGRSSWRAGGRAASASPRARRSRPTSWSPTPTRPGPTAISCRRRRAAAGPIGGSIGRATRWGCSSGTSARSDATPRSAITRSCSGHATGSCSGTSSSARSWRPTSASICTGPLQPTRRSPRRAAMPSMCSRRCRIWPKGSTGGNGPSPTGRPSPRRSAPPSCPTSRQQLVTSRLLTPEDFRDRLSSFRGAGFGLEPVLTQSAWFRPHNRSEEVDGLYLVGAGTHPGAGLPGVLSSARVLDRLVPHAALV